MYRAFHLKDIWCDDSCKRKLLNIYDDRHKNDKKIHDSIVNFILEDHSLNADAISKAFFPANETYDIFISHSHSDIDLVKAFAQWLENTFKLKCFIDSTVWGTYCDVQEKLDEYFMYNGDDSVADQISIHIYLMLNAALMQMMDRCEALFFLNTPSSIIPDDLLDTSTYSPWIFSEINMFNLMQKRKRVRKIRESVSMEEFSYVPIRHRLDFSKFTELYPDDLCEWEDRYAESNRVERYNKYNKSFEDIINRIDSNNKKNKHALDVLYELHPEKQ